MQPLNAIEARPGRPARMAEAAGRETVRVLTVGLHDEMFAIETDRVREILDLVPITRIPNSRPFIKGLINVRGKVIIVVDLRTQFGMVPSVTTPDTRIVVIGVRVDGETLMVGALADKVHAVTDLSTATLEDAPRLGMRWRPGLIKAIGKLGDDFVIIADIDQMFALEGLFETDQTAVVGP